MSWTRRRVPFEAWTARAQNSPPIPPQFQKQWELEVFEVNQGFPDGRTYKTSDTKLLEDHARFRIIFAPEARPSQEYMAQNLELFRILDVPEDFAIERTQPVSHSFGSRQNICNDSSVAATGYCLWFHFLGKNIGVRMRPDGGLEMHDPLLHDRTWALPGEDFSWSHGTFFLRTDQRQVSGEWKSCATLVCFDAPARVTSRLKEIIETKAWVHALDEPLILPDVILEGLHIEFDATMWKINAIFRSIERERLELLYQMDTSRDGHKSNQGGQTRSNSFTELHNLAKHIVYMSETMESCLKILDRTALFHSKNVGSLEYGERAQLEESFAYRRSMFESTGMRLTSPQKRVDNAITLSFNLVTQRDSMLMIQDSNMMKMIGAITMIFLPTTAVAAVAGSQLVYTTREGNEWNVTLTPVFWVTWWIAIPLTLCVIGTALLKYHMHRASRWKGAPSFVSGLSKTAKALPRAIIARISRKGQADTESRKRSGLAAG